MTGRWLPILGAVLCSLAFGAAPALAQDCPQTSLADLEDEVMCPVCGTALGLAERAPQAERERAFIQDLVDDCASKAEIQDALVREFGPAVLALPEDEGFNRAVYIVPIAAIVLALLGLALVLPRWRRRRAAGATAGAPPLAELDAEQAERLEDDLRRYD